MEILPEARLILALGIAALVVCTAGASGRFPVRRRKEMVRAGALDLKLTRVEQAAARKYRERLVALRRRLGALYLDGLPASDNRAVAEAFEAGAGFAVQSDWRKAGERWEDAQAKTQGTELAALKMLCAGCRLMLGRKQDARVDLEAALAAVPFDR